MGNAEYSVIPKGFKLGVGTSAYQVEGGWNEGGKGESIWDRLIHSNPDVIQATFNGDVACDSYHKYEEDIQSVANLGVDFYRFSISWSRILPTGFVNKINPEGVQYYNNLINGLIARGIEPAVTIYNWDLPQPIQELGGFLSEQFVEHYVDYARVLFENFGDRVKTWFTFSDPLTICRDGYGGGGLPPSIESSGMGDYVSGQNLLKAHAKAYRLYHECFRSEQKGRVSIILQLPRYQGDSSEESGLVEKSRQFTFGWFAHPIFTEEGDYPQVMKNDIAQKSAQQGFLRSRLPKLDRYWVDLIRGSADFIAVNTSTVTIAPSNPDSDYVSWENDIGASLSDDIKENSVDFRDVFRWVKNEYGDREIIVAESGWAEGANSGLEDHERIRYIHQYLTELLKAIHIDNVNITGYTYWSLMDKFEWREGFEVRSGLYHVDFEDPARPRTMKKSGDYFRELTSKRRLPENVN
ncbi:myrosinase 1-like [Athalia rosae]|uniref:myrosinase 1-like n=1 Tax=Athalia rosae TaxID=37344 RepID=UPI002033F8C7|nr:myrosinase 1-like [Athalia rosae]